MIDTPIMVASVNRGGTILKNYPVNRFITVPCLCKWAVSGEFWLGLDKIHRLTSTATELYVDMRDFDGNSAYAQYTSFSIGDSASKYILTVSGYSGTAGDSLVGSTLLSLTHVEMSD